LRRPDHDAGPRSVLRAVRSGVVTGPAQPGQRTWKRGPALATATLGACDFSFRGSLAHDREEIRVSR